MSEQTLAIYPNRDKNYEHELKLLEKANLSPRNKELITKFHNYLFSTGSGILRVSKLSSQLRRICAKLKVDLDKATKKDIIELVALYNRDTRYSLATKADYRRTLKQFYKWYKDEDLKVDDDDKEIRLNAKKFYNFLEKEISINYKKEQADPKTIITEEDCLAVVEKGCKTTREKAFISSLHETGCRAGEFLNMALGDITIKENHAEITVDGKTGRRTIFLVKSLPYLLRYLDVHPHKGNGRGYLWLSEAQHNANDPLLHKGAQKLVERCFEKAGFIIKEYIEVKLENGKTKKKLIRKEVLKKCNLHWFRHSRATILAPKLTEVMLCKCMGWVLGSRQIKTYCHLSVKQLENVVLAMHGIKPKEEETDNPLKCICGTLNNPNDRYCFRCCKPLKIETIIQDKELVDSEINKTIKFMMEMAKNPEMMKKFEEFKEKQTN